MSKEMDAIVSASHKANSRNVTVLAARAEVETQCDGCLEERPVFRKLTFADADGVVLDRGNYCEQCWNEESGLAEVLQGNFGLSAPIGRKG